MKATSSLVSETAVNAFQEIHADFKDILKNEKCRACSCFYTDVLNNILEKLRAYQKRWSDHRLVIIENDFERWVKEADVLAMHG